MTTQDPAGAVWVTSQNIPQDERDRRAKRTAVSFMSEDVLGGNPNGPGDPAGVKPL